MLERIFNHLETLGDKLEDPDPDCSGDLTCEKRNPHKCDYRPVAISTYIRKLKAL